MSPKPGDVWLVVSEAKDDTYYLGTVTRIEDYQVWGHWGTLNIIRGKCHHTPTRDNETWVNVTALISLVAKPS